MHIIDIFIEKNDNEKKISLYFKDNINIASRNNNSKSNKDRNDDIKTIMIIKFTIMATFFKQIV